MSTPNNEWSTLCPDLLRSIYEKLSFLDFHRARTVCSNWYSVSRTCPLYPWQIVFGGIDFSKLHCLASYGNWVLLVDPRLHFHLLNVFTRETINLPWIESSFRGGPYKFTRKDEFGCFLELYGTKFLVTSDDFKFTNTAVLWINERSGDYVVAWAIKQFYIFSYKKTSNDDDDDELWSLTCTQCEDMAYKNNKLYVYTFDHFINIFDFSGDFPKVIGEENPYLSHRFPFVDTIYKMRLAIANSGEVLIVLSLKDLNRKFCICKLNLEIGDWERVESLGEEMLVFGHGVTIRGPAKDIDGGGIKSNSICFLEEDHLSDSYLRHSVWGVFDLATSRITWHTRIEHLFSRIFWFVPGQA